MLNSFKKSYIIVTPVYQKSNGIRALHTLATSLMKRGYDVALFSHEPYKDEYKYISKITQKMRENAIVVYPEIIKGNPLQFRNVVRWILYYPGVLGGTETYHPSECLFTWSKDYCADTPLLVVPFLDTSLFYSDATPKAHNSFFVHKGGQFREVPEISDAVRIDMQYPSSREELANLLRSTKTLYSFDDKTALLDEASLCGVEVKIITEDDIVEFTSEYENLYSEDITAKQLDHFIGITQALNYQGPLEPSELSYYRRVYFKVKAWFGRVSGKTNKYYRYSLRN